MKVYRHGLVLGKFYPPHAGHHHLVRTAAVESIGLEPVDAESVCVDRDRTVCPVSGTAARKDPVGCWDFLEPPVRAALARRVVVRGAESTGTTLDEVARTVVLTGPHEQRLAAAVTAVDALLNQGWDLADPLPERR